LQAHALGDRLKQEGLKFDIVYASPAVRAMSTAKIVCDTIGFSGKIVKSDDLQEISQGDWEGKMREQIHTDEVIEEMHVDTLNFHAPNGESQLDVQKRMEHFIYHELLQNLKDTNTEINVAAFSHGLAVKCLIRSILNSNPSLTYKISIENCSITEFKFIINGMHPGWHIVRINDAAHLFKTGNSPYNFNL
jgi:broad specificity phosphatase PhoE